MYKRQGSAWVDPATPNTFKRLLKKKGFFLRGADNDVIAGIVTTSRRLSEGNIKIHKRIKNLKVELAGYVWDKTNADKGIDKPEKKDDHGCDALRYYAHSTGKIYYNLRNHKVPQQFYQ